MSEQIAVATDDDPISACCAGNTGGLRHEGCVYKGCRCECHRNSKRTQEQINKGLDAGGNFVGWTDEELGRKPVVHNSEITNLERKVVEAAVNLQQVEDAKERASGDLSFIGDRTLTLGERVRLSAEWVQELDQHFGWSEAKAAFRSAVDALIAAREAKSTEPSHIEEEKKGNYILDSLA